MARRERYRGWCGLALRVWITLCVALPLLGRGGLAVELDRMASVGAERAPTRPDDSGEPPPRNAVENETREAEEELDDELGAAPAMHAGRDTWRALAMTGEVGWAHEERALFGRPVVVSRSRGPPVARA